MPEYSTIYDQVAEEVGKHGRAKMIQAETRVEAQKIKSGFHSRRYYQRMHIENLSRDEAQKLTWAENIQVIVRDKQVLFAKLGSRKGATIIADIPMMRDEGVLSPALAQYMRSEETSAPSAYGIYRAPKLDQAPATQLPPVKRMTKREMWAEYGAGLAPTAEQLAEMDEEEAELRAKERQAEREGQMEREE